MTDSTGVTTRTYDQLNRAKTKTVPDIGTITFQYDITTGLSAGQWQETDTDPEGNVTSKVYDKAGRLISVTSGTATTAYTYYDNGNKHTVTYPNGAYEEYTYYENNQLHTLVNMQDSQTEIETYSYTYDLAGNMASKTDGTGTTQYTYDDLERLDRVTEPGGKVTSYTYDASGNREYQTVEYQSSSVVTSYSCDERNRLTRTEETLADGTINVVDYYYDPNGNLLAKQAYVVADAVSGQTEGLSVSGGVPEDSASYEYDCFNQLVVSYEEDATVTYTYNGEGNRVQKQVGSEIENYLYVNNKVVLELDENGDQTALNVWGTSIISRIDTTVAMYYMFNGHGDVTAIINVAGVVIAAYDYDAFGNVLTCTGESSNPYKYAGYAYDEETGLYYLNARYYDSVTARFISKDTYAGSLFDPLSLNLYTYCHNNPLMYTDPFGHSPANVSIDGRVIGNAQNNNGVTTGNLRDVVGALGGNVDYNNSTRIAHELPLLILMGRQFHMT